MPPKGRANSAGCTGKRHTGTMIPVIDKEYTWQKGFHYALVHNCPPHPHPPLGGEGMRGRHVWSLSKKCSPSKPRGPIHDLYRLEGLGYRPGFKALAVGTRVLAHYRGRFGELPEKKLAVTRFRERRFAVSRQALAKPVFGVSLNVAQGFNLPKRRDSARRSE